MSLSKRDRVWVNAALVTIHDAGHDPQAVINSARHHMAGGKSAVQAYKQAMNEKVAAAPKLQASLSHVIRLMQASDDRTINRYDKALSAYIETGDPDAFNGVKETFLNDSMTMAYRNGQDVQDVAQALGFTDPGTLQEAASRVSATFGFAPAGEQQAPDIGGEIGPTGYVSAKANAKQRYDEQMAGPAMRMAFPGHSDHVPMSREAARASAAARPEITVTSTERTY